MPNNLFHELLKQLVLFAIALITGLAVLGLGFLIISAIFGPSPPRHGSVVKSPDYSSGMSEQEMEAKKNQILNHF